MSDYPEGPGWWQASDQKWYPPESFPSDAPAQQPPPSDASFGQPAASVPSPGVPPAPGIPPAPGAPGYPGGPGYPGMVAQPKNNGLAVGSMIVSIVSVLCLPPVGLVGAIMGHVALGQIKRSGGMQTGRGMALAGIIVGWIAVALFIVGIIILASGDGEFTIE